MSRLVQKELAVSLLHIPRCGRTRANVWTLGPAWGLKALTLGSAKMPYVWTGSHPPGLKIKILPTTIFHLRGQVVLAWHPPNLTLLPWVI